MVPDSGPTSECSLHSVGNRLQWSCDSADARPLTCVHAQVCLSCTHRTVHTFTTVHQVHPARLPWQLQSGTVSLHLNTHLLHSQQLSLHCIPALQQLPSLHTPQQLQPLFACEHAVTTTCCGEYGPALFAISIYSAERTWDPACAEQLFSRRPCVSWQACPSSEPCCTRNELIYQSWQAYESSLSKRACAAK